MGVALSSPLATTPAVAAHTVLAWRDGELRPIDEAPAGALLAADSWLLAEGRVRGYERHWARFAGWCEDARVDPAQLAGFRAATTAELPREGRWFPRVDLVGSAAGRASAQLLLRLRPAQPPLLRARVHIAHPGDPRRHPRRKGPDLALLLGLRADAGADEVVLRDAAGRLLEGAFNSVLWWEGDALCATEEERTLPSVTRALLLELAARRGVEVRRRSPLPDELDGCEAWLVNAAQGICVVSAWEPGGPRAGPGVRAAEWRAALDATARDLP